MGWERTVRRKINTHCKEVVNVIALYPENTPKRLELT